MIYKKLTGAVREHGGSLRGFAGDGIMAVFGVPEAQKDTALRSCRTALAIYAAFAAAADAMDSQFPERPIMRAGVSSRIAVKAPPSPPSVIPSIFPRVYRSWRRRAAP